MASIECKQQSQWIEFEDHRYWAKIALNRPEVHNALNPDTIRFLKDIISKLAKDQSKRAIVFEAKGRSFCAGADLEWMKSMSQASKSENRDDALKLFDMFLAIRMCPIPTIGKVHGNVMGGGLGLVSALDIVSAETETHFCFSETRIGLVPAVISPFVWAKMEHSFARQFMISAQSFDSIEALKSGLIQHAGSISECNHFVQKQLDHLLKLGPEAVRATKNLLNLFDSAHLGEFRERVAQVIADRRISQEAQEGMSSFLEKRAPSWKLGSKELDLYIDHIDLKSEPKGFMK